MPSTVTWGEQQRTTEYAYDADGVRVRKSDAEQTMTYVGGKFEPRTEAGTGVVRSTTCTTSSRTGERWPR